MIGSVKNMLFYGALLATVASLLSSNVVSEARANEFGAGFGMQPGAFSAKTHSTLGLVPRTGMGPAREVALPTNAIKNAPPATAAGSHPDGSVTFYLKDLDPRYPPPPSPLEEALPDGLIRDVRTDLPSGFVGDPEAVPACPREQLEEFKPMDNGFGDPTKTCSPETQVGVITLNLALTYGPTYTVPVYRVTRSETAPASFGFVVVAQPIILNARLRSDGDYGISVDSRNTGSAVPIKGATVTLWGVPADPIHDPDRWNPATLSWGASVTSARRPFLINPPRCNSGQLETWMAMRSWQFPNVWLPLDTEIGAREDYVSRVPEPSECDGLSFSANFEMQPTSRTAGKPAGYKARLTMPYNDDPDGRSYPHLRRVEVSLPEGVGISPGAATGLNACTDKEAGFGTQSVAACPDASKIGRVSVKTPLLPEPLKGEMFIGEPTAESLYRVFIIFKGYGVVVRVVGDVEPDRRTGQIRAVFDNNPQLPFTEMDIEIDSGPTAPLANPKACGKHITVAKLRAWSGSELESRSSFDVSSDGQGIGCPGRRSFNPKFAAGLRSPLAGVSSPFALRINRDDLDAEVDSISVQMPQGLVASIAGVRRCAAALADAGRCGPESRIGRVVAAAGAGPSPFWVPEPGKEPTSVSIAGPYRGAPFSLSIVVPAQAGPFDLGRVVVRTPIHVDERTTEISVGVAESRIYDRFGRLTRILPGKLPTILEGVPLRLQELRVEIDREGFMVSPTGCTEKQIRAEVGSDDGQVAHLVDRFQVTDCAALGFAPRFEARIMDRGRRSTLRSFNPRMKFVVRPRAGEANITSARVTLPSSVILDQSHIRTTCTRAQRAARACPQGSIYGYARAWSPLLDEPLEGPVFLQANGGVRPLPDLSVDLRGEVNVALEGFIDTARGGRIRNRFAFVPDVPVSRFELTMAGGRRGLLVNSTDLCLSRAKGTSNMRGANGRIAVTKFGISKRFRGCRAVRKRR